ncbi:DUF4406 domain-containing protein [Zhenhengia yiwuensis]|uniref:DUF7768 domain-containing protein n=1 Tax=Zhenhengia yiwuensis TaxID=2763666 RepID=UPI002A749E55|nr:DUF4406 domain-containing protein [Zhenhengia yiwuensis]MDY3369401.1 DUF4406 domain-containing protein [Zhenhengia yiwuensis]
MKMIYICSPLKGDVEMNIQRANRFCRFAARNEVLPLAPHTIFTQWLDDADPDEREAGIYLGLELLTKCDEVWVFGNRITEGMTKEIEFAVKLKKPVLYYNDKCEMITG